MKASVKLREDQHPLLRAKLPVDLIRSLPLFAGVSVGSSQEFALHVGSSLQAGLSGRVSYRPNDAHNPFALTLKSTFDPRVVVSSSTKAVFSVAAEFSLSRRGCPSFRLWVKPRIGDYSLSKSQDFGGRSCNHRFEGGLIELKEVSEGGRTVKLDQDHSFSSPVSLKDGCSASASGQRQLVVANGVDVSPFGGREQQQSWSFRYADDDTRFSRPNFTPETNSQERPDSMNKQQQRVTLDCCESASHGSGLNFVFPRQNEGRQLGFSRFPNVFHHQSPEGIPRSRLKKSFSGWSLRAHTSLPVSRHVVARIRWIVDLPSDLFESLESGPFSFLKLPMLSMDKVTVEGMDPLKRPRKPMYSKNASEDMRFKNPYRGMREKNPELEHFAAMCSSMKQQLHFLHSENKVLMKNMDDLRAELNCRGIREFDAIKIPAKDYSMEDENLLYLHLFGEILAKCDNTSKGMFLGNIRRLKNGKEDFLENDKRGVRLDGGTSDDHPSDIPQELQKAIIKVNGGNFSRK